MRLVNIFLVIMFVGVGYLFYKGLVSIPDQYVNDAMAFNQALEKAQSKLDAQRKAYQSQQELTDWKVLSPYASKEEWEQFLRHADDQLNKAKAIKENDVLPILDRDHKEDIEALVLALRKGRSLLKDTASKGAYPAQRAKTLLAARDHKEDHLKKAQSLFNLVERQAESFYQTANDAAVKHSHKQNDLASKMVALQDLVGSVNQQRQIMENEYESTSTDFAVYADAFTSINTQYQAATQYIDENKDLVAQLDRSYVKILSDQKIDYFVVIGRASWCDGDYCGEGSEMQYPPVQVDENTFEYFDYLNLDTIATRSSGWGRPKFTLSIPQNRWDALKISETYRLNTGEPEAEYWVEKTEAKSYHRYAYIENGDLRTETWVAVPNDLYWKHEEHLGMALETKPIGHYEVETLKTAEPVGMATIAEPTMVNGVPSGSNQYGEWRHNNGVSFWHYYGMYRMFGDFITPGRYTYNDWNGYHRYRGKGVYYGQEDEYGTYGSSTYSHHRYKNSDYSKRNPGIVRDASTGHKSQSQPSIRGAGSASRGKGPSGSGK